MAKSPIVATEEMNLEEVLYLMQRHKIRRMPVVRGENDLCGIIVISDIYPFVGPHAMTKALLSEEVAAQLRNVRVASVMTNSPITCSRNATIDEIGVIMRSKKIGAVPVLEGTKVVGIITESDILGALSSITQTGSDSKRIFFRIPVMDKINTFYKIVSLCEQNELEILTILIHPIPEEHSHLVMMRVHGKKVPEFIDMLWRHHYEVLVTSMMPVYNA
ncbi:MAG: CBS domain-containing protein [Deltaproteobacteria bacterium]|nr:CBS domain-containing protein [Deltaproteobacteria bacterium]